MSSIIEQVKKLPQAPGVYFFYDAEKNLLYIGKATNLRSRVSSYFRGLKLELDSENRSLAPISVQGRSEWIGMMVSQVADIAYEQTDSVLEALILESNLIKAHQPKYNTLEKDDKSFAYFVITKEEFPRVLIVRKTDLDEMSKSKISISNKIQNPKSKFKYTNIIVDKTFGPYTSKFQMQIALKIMRRIFPFHAHKAKTEKGCLDFQMGVCP